MNVVDMGLGFRPGLEPHQVVCDKCNKPCRFIETGLSRGKRGGGYLLIMAECHGEVAEGMIPYGALADNPSQILRLFTPPGYYALSQDGTTLLLDSIKSNPTSKVEEETVYGITIGKEPAYRSTVQDDVIDVDAEVSSCPSLPLLLPPPSEEPR